MKYLYSQKNLSLSRRKARLCACLTAVLAALALIICVRLCMGVNVINENRIRLWTTLISSAAGCLILLVSDLYLLPARAESRHAERILAMEASPVSGVVERVSPPRRIRGSVDIREVILTTGAGKKRLLIAQSRSREFPGPGNSVSVMAADSFITAFEVCHE